QRLNVRIGFINTIVLLTSSLTMALAVWATRVGRQRMLVWCLTLTAVLGTLFMVFKGIEYTEDYVEGLVPNTQVFRDRASEWDKELANPQKVQLFLLLYYAMTGLHAVHLTIGISLMIYLTVRARRGHFTPNHYIPVEVTGLYWHFV